MRVTASSCAWLLLCGLLSSAIAAEPNDRLVVYTGATLIDGTGAEPKRDVAVVTRGERIEAILPARGYVAPEGSEVVNVAGRYVVAGLINSHVHYALPPQRKFSEAMMRRAIYGGVTAVRSMGDDVRALADLARAARVGEIDGPDIYYAAFFAGRDFFADARLVSASQGATAGAVPWQQAIDEKTDLATAVTLARGTGAVGIKIYANLSAPLVKRIVDEAHRQGMKAWAHSMVFPATPLEVAEAGPDVMSHVGYLGYQAVEERPSRYQDREKFILDPARFTDGPDEQLLALFRKMREKRIILDATNYVFHTIERMRERNLEDAPPPPYCTSALAELLCAQAHRHGILISAGTDSFSEREDPYSALQSEAEILVRKVGMTPMEALRSATIISAMTIGQEKEMGTIEPGKLANFVFLSTDPLADIGALRNVTLTVKRGVQYPRDRYRPVTEDEVEGRPL